VASTARARATDKEAPGTVFTFAIGGKAPLPKFKTYQSAGLLEGVKYALWILSWRSGRRQRWNIKNLGWAPAEEIANLKDMVFKGPFTDQGMPDFTGKLSEDDVVKIQAFVQGDGRRGSIAEIVFFRRLFAFCTVRPTRCSKPYLVGYPDAPNRSLALIRTR